MKKLFIVICIVLIAFVFCSDYVFGITDPVLENPYKSNLAISNVKTKAKNVWATVRVLVQITSVACVVFAGLRYMFASADQKADIKQGLIYLSIGAALVFGATSIIQMVANAAETVID